MMNALIRTCWTNFFVFSLGMSTLLTPSVSLAQLTFSDGKRVSVLQSTRLVFLGEDHKSNQLAQVVLLLMQELRRNENYNCLFIESPSDVQSAFDKSVSTGNIQSLYDAAIQAARGAYFATYKKLGSDTLTLQKLEAAFENAAKDFPTYPVDAALLKYLNKEKIHLVAYDAISQSKEYNDSVFLRIVDLNQPPEPARAVLSHLATNVRNEIMTKNISAKFQSAECNKAIVVVGSGHLISHERLAESYRIDFGYRSLQFRLRELGLTGATILTEIKPKDSASSSHAPSDWYPDFIGNLWTAQ
jgi:uncharacterized iron-regulated protein